MRKLEKELKEQRALTADAVRQAREARDRVHVLENLSKSEKATSEKLRAALLHSHDLIRNLRADLAKMQGALSTFVRTADLANGRAELKLMPGHDLLAVNTVATASSAESRQ